MDQLLQDLRYAARRLRASPGFTLAVVVTLALGIGVNTAMFGVADALFFRPPAEVREPGRVRRVYFTMPSFAGVQTTSITTYPDYADLRDGMHAFSQIAVVGGRNLTVGRGPEAREAQGQLVSHTFFPLLGVEPALGRFFGADEDREHGGAHVAVLSWGYWQRVYGGRDDVLGRTLPIGSSRYTVIGVAPKGFTGDGLGDVDLWLPIMVAAPEGLGAAALTRDWMWLHLLGRLAPGASDAQAAAEATTVYRRAEVRGERRDSAARVTLGPIQAARGPEAGPQAKVSLWVVGVAGFVLLIACANVANLLLARALARRQEIAVRLALGAGRRRLLRQLLTESVLLALLGAAAAVVLALWLGPMVRALVLSADVTIDTVVAPRVLAFTAAIALATGILSGLLPALHASRAGLGEAVKSGARTTGGRSGRTRTALVVGQVALTTMLLVGAGLFVRSVRNVLASLDGSMDVRRVLTADADLEGAGIDSVRAAALYDALLARARTLPGVERAALSRGGPFGWSYATRVRLSGGDTLPRFASGGPYIYAVTPGFHETIGTRLLRGRTFTDADGAGGARVAVIGATLARAVWPGGDAIGRCLRIGSDTAPCAEVVGVVTDPRRNAAVESPQLQIYIPLAQVPAMGRRMLFLRVADPAQAPAIQRALQATAPDLPFVRVASLAEAVAGTMNSYRLGATLFSAFGLLALLVAAVGLNSALAYVVAQRVREIGVRIALGADLGTIVWMILRQGVGAALLGVALGLGAAAVASRWAAPLLYGVTPADPLTYAAVAVVFGLVAAVACAIPARRAARVDPMTALRSE